MDNHPRDQKISAKIALVITSDTRTTKTDKTGKTAIELIENAGHKISFYEIVSNNQEKIHEIIVNLLDGNSQVIITSGGTGISPRDKTIDAVKELLDRTLPGFGEHFRRLSYDEIGITGIMSRALAGVSNGKLLFCLPGSSGAMKTALNEIILPSIGHSLWELNRE